jgi:hypothetical protein
MIDQFIPAAAARYVWDKEALQDISGADPTVFEHKWQDFIAFKDRIAYPSRRGGASYAKAPGSVTITADGVFISDE